MNYGFIPLIAVIVAVGGMCIYKFVGYLYKSMNAARCWWDWAKDRDLKELRHFTDLYRKDFFKYLAASMVHLTIVTCLLISFIEIAKIVTGVK